VRRCGSIFLVLAALVLASTASAAGGANHSYVIRGNVVGGFPTATGGAAEAFAIFGGPFPSTQSGSQCIGRWGDGLVLTFKRRLPYSAWSKACRRFISAVITDRRWQTDRGLRVGSEAAAIRHAYPSAVSKPETGGVTSWNLVPGLNPALRAWTKGDHVISLRIVRS